MQQVQLSDRLYQHARQRAATAGFESVDEFVADVVSQALGEDTENFDHLFTPERLKQLGEISAEIKAGGKTYSLDEVEHHFIEKRKAWLKDHAS